MNVDEFDVLKHKVRRAIEKKQADRKLSRRTPSTPPDVLISELINLLTTTLGIPQEDLACWAMKQSLDKMYTLFLEATARHVARRAAGLKECRFWHDLELKSLHA